MSGRFMSVNQFLYLPIVTNPENNPCIQTVIRSPPKFNHLLTGPLPTFPKKFHANPVGSFCAKLLTDRQTTSRRKHTLLGGGNKYFFNISNCRASTYVFPMQMQIEHFVIVGVVLILHVIQSCTCLSTWLDTFRRKLKTQLTAGGTSA